MSSCCGLHVLFIDVASFFPVYDIYLSTCFGPIHSVVEGKHLQLLVLLTTVLGLLALHDGVGSKLGTLGSRSIARGGATTDLVDLNDACCDLNLLGQVGVDLSCLLLLTVEQFLAEVWFTAEGTCETDNVARLLLNRLSHDL